MVEYLQSKKGYFYKLKKNGEKKRISQEEYNKKNKTRKNKKMIGGVGELIEESDIMYQDDLVCILRPDVKKGIIVWTHFTQPVGMNSLCNLGLKTGKKLKEEGVNFGRTKIHPYIFFRAPYYSRDIDYTSVETEIISSYGEGQIGKEPRAFIRVDPDRTFVFSSEIRAKIPSVYFHKSDGHLLTKQELSLTHSKFLMSPDDERYRELYNEYYNHEINKSKKTLSEYLVIIKQNESMPELTIYNLYTSKKVRSTGSNIYPYDRHPIEENSEILVSIPHLTPDYFVLCTP
jgi:hypothetical protein